MNNRLMNKLFEEDIKYRDYISSIIWNTNNGVNELEFESRDYVINDEDIGRITVYTKIIVDITNLDYEGEFSIDFSKLNKEELVKHCKFDLKENKLYLTIILE